MRDKVCEWVALAYLSAQSPPVQSEQFRDPAIGRIIYGTNGHILLNYL